jgi:hypothetical protein
LETGLVAMKHSSKKIILYPNNKIYTSIVGKQNSTVIWVRWQIDGLVIWMDWQKDGLVILVGWQKDG